MITFSSVIRFTIFKIKHFWEPATIIIWSCLFTVSEKAQDIGEGPWTDWCQQTQHQHWNYVLWEGRYSYIQYHYFFYIKSCNNKMMTKILIIWLLSGESLLINFIFVITENTWTGEEGTAELWGVRQLPAVSSHFQPGSDLSCRAGPVSHPISWVSLNMHTVCYTYLQSPALYCLYNYCFAL